MLFSWWPETGLCWLQDSWSEEQKHCSSSLMGCSSSSTSCVVRSGRIPSVPVQEEDKSNCVVVFCSLGTPLNSSWQAESYLEISKKHSLFSVSVTFVSTKNCLFWKEIDNFTYFSDGCKREVPCEFCMASPPVDVCHISLCPLWVLVS